MSKNTDLIKIEAADMISAENMLTRFGIVSSDTVEGIALNMVEHHRGKVPGGYIKVTDEMIEKSRTTPGMASDWRRSHDQNGNEIIVRPGTKREKGDLLYPDAVRVTQKTLSRGLNPLAHISLWYHGGQLVDNVNYTIMKGMAEQQGQSKFEFFDMSPEEVARHGLKPADIGKVAYLVMDSDKPLLLKATVELSSVLEFREARREALEMIAKAKGIGIVRKEEGLYALKGRSLEWTAEKRAGVDAIRRAFGEMTPAQIAHYASGQGFLSQQNVQALASPDYQSVAGLPAEDQQHYLAAAQITERIKNDSPQPSPGGELMRAGNGDDDPIEDQAPLPPGMEASTKFWSYANARNLDRAYAGQFIAQADGDLDRALELLEQAE
jgi:hypothetical protein